VGFPSVGKSTLLNALTNAESETGQYEFTTLDVEPGMLKHKGANIQILDVPGLIGSAADGRGDGTQVLSVVRNADLVLVLLDPEKMRYDKITQELYNADIRLNESRPDMKIEKKGQGGIDISSTVDLEIGEDTIRDIMQQRGYINANVIIRERLDLDRFIDGLMDNRKYVPMISAVNKIDEVDGETRKEMEDADCFCEESACSSNPEECCKEHDLVVSAETRENLEELKDLIFESLGLIRIYMKKKGEEPDKEEPLILREGDTVGDALDELPGDMKDRFKTAKVTGESSKFPEQKVGEEHALADEDILELNLRHV